jgi:hypothetical protein
MSVVELEELCGELGLEPIDLDDLVHDCAASMAATINNGGLEHQLKFLQEQLGDSAAESIRQLKG